MLNIERDYMNLVDYLLTKGQEKYGRNGRTMHSFGHSLSFDLRSEFPLLQGRKIFYMGVLGELAALLRRPKSVEDFKRWGCNYWGAWADADGKLELDYGNAWFDFNGFDQVAELRRLLRDDPTSRRMIINAWRPDRLGGLSLPCCHYSYQFNYCDGVLDLIWAQRSADLMIGVPSDMVLAAVLLMIVANEFEMTPGKVKMDFGDVHIYEEHVMGALQYVRRDKELHSIPTPIVRLNVEAGTPFTDFIPDWVEVMLYTTVNPSITFLLKE